MSGQAKRDCNDLTAEQQKTLLDLINMIGGDTWNEGDYLFDFTTARCNFTVGCCDFDIKVTDPCDGSDQIFERHAQVTSFRKYSDLVTFVNDEPYEITENLCTQLVSVTDALAKSIYVPSQAEVMAIRRGITNDFWDLKDKALSVDDDQLPPHLRAVVGKLAKDAYSVHEVEIDSARYYWLDVCPDEVGHSEFYTSDGDVVTGYSYAGAECELDWYATPAQAGMQRTVGAALSETFKGSKLGTADLAALEVSHTTLPTRVTRVLLDQQSAPEAHYYKFKVVGRLYYIQWPFPGNSSQLPGPHPSFVWVSTASGKLICIASVRPGQDGLSFRVDLSTSTTPKSPQHEAGDRRINVSRFLGSNEHRG